MYDQISMERKQLSDEEKAVKYCQKDYVYERPKNI